MKGGEFFLQFSCCASIHYYIISFNMIKLEEPDAEGCKYCDGHDCLLTRENVPSGKGASGNWKVPSFPKRNWVCVEVYDRGEDDLEVCGMCEREHVRYMHVMKHGTLILHVGCICAAYMDGTLDGVAKGREKMLRSRPARYANFMDESKWKTSAKGNPYYTMKRSEYNPETKKIILSKSKFDEKYSFMVISLTEDGEESNERSDGYLASKNDAKECAFNMIFPSRIFFQI
jgi:hypothetical protein